MGNAVYRDLVQALVMVQVDHLVLAVPNVYKYQSGGKLARSTDYANTRGVSGISCVRRVTAFPTLFSLPVPTSNAGGRCGKPRSLRFSKSLWTRGVRPQGRQRPCAGAFYAVGGVNRSP
jgi:hypothetical protein